MLYKQKRKYDFWRNVSIFIVGELEIMLAVRFFLRLIGANPSNAVTNIVYLSTDPLVRPFVSIFTQEVLLEISEVEFFTLFAMFVYMLLLFAIVAFISLFEPK